MYDNITLDGDSSINADMFMHKDKKFLFVLSGFKVTTVFAVIPISGIFRNKDLIFFFTPTSSGYFWSVSLVMLYFIFVVTHIHLR